MNLPPDTPAGPRPVILDAQQLSKSYPSPARPLTVVKDISFAIAAGSSCAIPLLDQVGLGARLSHCPVQLSGGGPPAGLGGGVGADAGDRLAHEPGHPVKNAPCYFAGGVVE